MSDDLDKMLDEFKRDMAAYEYKPPVIEEPKKSIKELAAEVARTRHYYDWWSMMDNIIEDHFDTKLKLNNAAVAYQNAKKALDAAIKELQCPLKK